MAIHETKDGSIIVTGSGSIQLFRLMTLRSMLKLELSGLRVSKGRTAYSILKSELRLHGQRQAVLAQVDALLNTYKANAGAQGVM